MIIPRKSVGIVNKNKNGGYHVARIGRDGKTIAWDDLSDEGFQEMKDNLLSGNQNKERIEELEKRIKLLELQLLKYEYQMKKKKSPEMESIDDFEYP